MLTLYWFWSFNPQKVRLALEELGLDYSLVDCCYGPMLDALSLAGDHLAAYPALGSYLARMRERKAWKACGFRAS